MDIKFTSEEKSTPEFWIKRRIHWLEIDVEGFIQHRDKLLKEKVRDHGQGNEVI